MNQPAVVVMSEAAARDLFEQIRETAEQIRDRMEQLHGLLIEARDGSAYVALGLPSWTAFLSAAFADQPLTLDREQRRELVGYLAAEGMSTRAIAPIVGTSHQTVIRDLPTGPDGPVEPITGLNGKAYPRPTVVEPPRPPEPPPPETPEEWEARVHAAAIQRDVKRIEMFVSGWPTIATLGRSRHRDEIIGELAPSDRDELDRIHRTIKDPTWTI